MPKPDPDEAGKPEPRGDDKDRPIQTNPLIETMLSLSKQPARAIELVGYVGPSNQDGFFRLYFKLDLRNYLEIPTAGLIFAEKLDTADPAQPSKILINAATHLELVQRLEASFLEGSIATAHPARDPAGPFTAFQTTGVGDRQPHTPAPCQELGRHPFFNEPPPGSPGRSGGIGCSDVASD